MTQVRVRSGEHISSDIGLSDDFIFEALDNEGVEIVFGFEPGEWLEECETLLRAQLPAGATYEHVLLVSGTLFKVRFGDSDSTGRVWTFTVWDQRRERLCEVKLGEQSVQTLVDEVRRKLLA